MPVGEAGVELRRHPQDDPTDPPLDRRLDNRHKDHGSYGYNSELFRGLSLSQQPSLEIKFE